MSACQREDLAAQKDAVANFFAFSHPNFGVFNLVQPFIWSHFPAHPVVPFLEFSEIKCLDISFRRLFL